MATIPRSLLLHRWPTYANGSLRLQLRPSQSIPSPLSSTQISASIRLYTSTPFHASPTLQKRVRATIGAAQPVLEQPTKYNPPSHPTGPRKPAHTPLPPPPHQEQRKWYPGTMPPRGTWAYWILHSPGLHGVTAIGTLIALALYVMYRNFMDHDEAAKLAFWDPWHPLLSAQSFISAYRESDRLNTLRIMEKRRQISEDMERKAHYRYVVEGRSGAEGEGWRSIGVRRTQQDKDFGWGIMIDGKYIDQYIADKEKEKEEKKKLKQEGKDGEISAKVPIVVVEDGMTGGDVQDKKQKKGWW